jgi:hypothetical protein
VSAADRIKNQTIFPVNFPVSREAAKLLLSLEFIERPAAAPACGYGSSTQKMGGIVLDREFRNEPNLISERNPNLGGCHNCNGNPNSPYSRLGRIAKIATKCSE